MQADNLDFRGREFSVVAIPCFTACSFEWNAMQCNAMHGAMAVPFAAEDVPQDDSSSFSSYDTARLMLRLMATTRMKRARANAMRD
ncbi:uncharacterized protein MYCFIDRAFT_177268 [Pseudocercospora fijiensis CIRAD86]|uniref:Uncharacterized protein n=1 Tax=Pseudocercospora fijiensis (strain CIRAD86) TaxID=383855 RepID=M3A6S9_PSEFD|nr:uncharacterized protein MYCFIDRAFT_177268 [Pseudocercospora fijiensis CIRAD86]EME80311.1 hypothetical protein MYCFIDRAFT_177268 [Pseudocercospora fijiensis CIRAD86]